MGASGSYTVDPNFDWSTDTSTGRYQQHVHVFGGAMMFNKEYAFKMTGTVIYKRL